MAGTGVAARHGILIKDAQALELAHKVDVVAFDKTGTLTIGRPKLTALLPATGMDGSEALKIAAALQSGSEHPLARAVVASAKEQGLGVQAFVGHVQGRFVAVFQHLLALQDGQQVLQMRQLQTGQGLGALQALAGSVGNDQVHGVDCRRPDVCTAQ